MVRRSSNSSTAIPRLLEQDGESGGLIGGADRGRATRTVEGERQPDHDDHCLLLHDQVDQPPPVACGVAGADQCGSGQGDGATGVTHRDPDATGAQIDPHRPAPARRSIPFHARSTPGKEVPCLLEGPVDSARVLAPGYRHLGRTTTPTAEQRGDRLDQLAGVHRVVPPGVGGDGQVGPLAARGSPRPPPP